jgi:putative serine protease PepD
MLPHGARSGRPGVASPRNRPTATGMSASHRSPVAWAGALVVPAVVLALAGCGGSGSSSTSGTASAPVALAATTSTPSGGDVQTQFIRVVSQVSPQVVQIETDQGLGSGVVYDDQGHIVTNDHVVAGAKRYTVTLADSAREPASLTGRYTAGDLAVLQLKSGRPPKATFADSSKLKVGQLALAIGNPLGLRSSVTDGIISSLGRTVSEGPETGAVIASAIQTSASINPGNSGGALVDLDGQVVGIPTLAAVDPQLGGGAAPGIGFAIPSNTVTRIADQLIASGHVTRSGRAFLGVEVATGVTGSGVLVAAVQKNGPAADAGIRPGDRILSIAGKPTPTADDLTVVLADLKPGQTVPVALQRADGTKTTVDVKLGESPA